MDNEYKNGEELAIKCLKAKGIEVIDRRANPQYWKMDIDLTALYGNEKKDIEIKRDSKIHCTNAFFFELVADIGYNKQGWA